MKYFCIIKEKIAYMECVIQSSMFYSFYLFLSILLCNVDSALVSDSGAYIWISNCIQMFKFIFECWSNMFLVHALEKWRLQMMKKNILKRKEISLLLLLSFLNPKVLLRRGGGVLLSATQAKKVMLPRHFVSIKLPCNFFGNTLRHGCTAVNFLHIFETPFLKNTSGWQLLLISMLTEMKLCSSCAER